MFKTIIIIVALVVCCGCGNNDDGSAGLTEPSGRSDEGGARQPTIPTTLIGNWQRVDIQPEPSRSFGRAAPMLVSFQADGAFHWQETELMEEWVADASGKITGVEVVEMETEVAGTYSVSGAVITLKLSSNVTQDELNSAICALGFDEKTKEKRVDWSLKDGKLSLKLFKAGPTLGFKKVTVSPVTSRSSR